MQVVILAAGAGRRMAPSSDGGHKALVELTGGQTILSRIVDSVLAAGLTRIAVVTGYRGEDVTGYLRGRYPEQAFRFIHNDRFAETNNIQSLALATEQLDLGAGWLLIESDLVFDPLVIRRLLADPRDDVAVVDRFRPGMDGTVVTMGPDGTIERLHPASRPGEDFPAETTFKTVNLYRFSGAFTGPFAKLLRWYAAQVDDTCYYEVILGMLVAAGRARIHGLLVEPHEWAEVDDPNDLTRARFVAAPDRRRDLLDESWGGHWGLPIVDFAFPRNLHYPTAAAVAELRRQLPELIAGYGSAQSVLDRKASWLLQVPARNVVALNGAAQVFPWLAEVFAGARALCPDPTFQEWIRAFPQADRYPDVPRPPRLAVTDADVVVVVNPNNPTGSVVPTAELLESIVARSRTMFLIDESFLDFSAEPSIIPLLRDRQVRNALVVKSLGKSLGMPGVRLGVAFSCDEELLGRLRASLPVWNLNSIAERQLELALKHREVLAESFRRTAADRAELARALADCSIVDHVAPSAANFLLVRLSGSAADAAELADALLARWGLYVKDVSARFPGGGWWRVSVRPAADRQRLIDALTTLAAGAEPP